MILANFMEVIKASMLLWYKRLDELLEVRLPKVGG